MYTVEMVTEKLRALGFDYEECSGLTDGTVTLCSATEQVDPDFEGVEPGPTKYTCAFANDDKTQTHESRGYMVRCCEEFRRGK